MVKTVRATDNRIHVELTLRGTRRMLCGDEDVKAADYLGDGALAHHFTPTAAGAAQAGVCRDCGVVAGHHGPDALHSKAPARHKEE